jgi:hypothetical protein
MFPNWTGWKTTKSILFALSALAGVVPAQYQTAYTAVIGSIGVVVVFLSGTNAGPAMAGKVVK